MQKFWLLHLLWQLLFNELKALWVVDDDVDDDEEMPKIFVFIIYYFSKISECKKDPELENIAKKANHALILCRYDRKAEIKDWRLFFQRIGLI